jgi:4a-hydroxytetrahydrobiopterin dehydratase
MRARLTDAELQDALQGLPKWRLEHGQLTQTIAFSSFEKTIEFVNEAAALAEKADHHPDIDIRYNRLRFVLVTHDVGGITHNDVEMAAQLDTALKAHI